MTTGAITLSDEWVQGLAFFTITTLAGLVAWSLRMLISLARTIAKLESRIEANEAMHNMQYESLTKRMDRIEAH